MKTRLAGEYRSDVVHGAHLNLSQEKPSYKIAQGCLTEISHQVLLLFEYCCDPSPPSLAFMLALGHHA